MANTATRKLVGEEATMEADLPALQLHNRATRGDTLTAGEQAALADWYERQDAEEDARLVSSPLPVETALRPLRNDVEAASARMLTVTQDIQTLVAENEALHQEIAALTQRLAQSKFSQPA